MPGRKRRLPIQRRLNVRLPALAATFRMSILCDTFATHSPNDGDDRRGACLKRNRTSDSVFTAGMASLERAMSEYSIYTITDEDRQFSQSCTVVHCADDVEAIEAAAQWVDLYDVELWESNRFITRFHASNVQMLD